MSLQCQCQVQRLCFGKKLFTYVYMYAYVQIYGELFSKACSPNLALAFQHRFLNWRLMRFGKDLFIWKFTYKCIYYEYIYIYIHNIYLCRYLYEYISKYSYVDFCLYSYLYVYLSIYEELFSKTQ